MDFNFKFRAPEENYIPEKAAGERLRIRREEKNILFSIIGRGVLGERLKISRTDSSVEKIYKQFFLNYCLVFLSATVHRY